MSDGELVYAIMCLYYNSDGSGCQEPDSASKALPGLGEILFHLSILGLHIDKNECLP